MSQFETKAFVGKVTKFDFKSEEGDDQVKYFAKIVIPHNDKENERTYQYMDCYVSKSLLRLFASIHANQIDDTDGKTIHSLSGIIATVNIVKPFFDINEDGYLAGKGILTSLTFA